MGKAISEEGKLRENRGTGTKESYKPWIKIREINSIGVSTSFPDWKHGRMVQLLSRGELAYYLLLRWNDDVDDIREQFPLDIERTDAIAEKLGFRKKRNGKYRMTTDMLVTMIDGSLFAVSINNTRADLKKSDRKVELQMIEYYYWKSLGVPWKILYKEDINSIEVENIMDIVSYYNMKTVPDEIGLVKYLIAHKYILVDLKSPIDYKQLIEAVKEDEIWKKYSYMLG